MDIVSLITLFSVPQVALMGVLIYLSQLEDELNNKKNNDGIKHSQSAPCLSSLTELKSPLTMPITMQPTYNPFNFGVPSRQEILDAINKLKTTELNIKEDTKIEPFLQEIQQKRFVLDERNQDFLKSPMRKLVKLEADNIKDGLAQAAMKRRYQSPMRNCAMMHETTFVWYRILKHNEDQVRDSCPLRKINSTELNAAKSALKRNVSILIGDNSYNCNSFSLSRPLDWQKLKIELINFTYTYCYRSHMRAYHITTKFNQSPNHKLATDITFKKELNQLLRYNHYKQCNRFVFKILILPNIHEQYKIVMSQKFRNLLNNSLFLAKLIHFEHKERLIRFNSSPLHKLSINKNFLYELKIFYLDRKTTRFNFMISPMREVAIKNRTKLKFAYLTRRDQYELYETSPFSSWTVKNYYNIIHKSMIFNKRRIIETQNINQLAPVTNEIKLIKHDNMIGHLVKSNLPLIVLNDNNTSQLVITFENQADAHHFKNTYKLSDFTQQTIFYNKDKLMTECSHMYPSSITVKDIISSVKSLKYLLNACETYHNVSLKVRSHMTKTHPIIIENNGKINRLASIRLIRRDQGLFTSKMYNNCVNVCHTFNKKHTSLEFKQGFLDNWLSKDMVIFVKCPANSINSSEFYNMITDLIRHCNMVNNVIFASLNIELEWINEL